MTKNSYLTSLVLLFFLGVLFSHPSLAASEKTAFPTDSVATAPKVVRGTIVDSIGQPVSYAHIVAFEQDKYIAGEGSDAKGAFILSIPSTEGKEIKLTVTAVGFSRYDKMLTESDYTNPLSIVLNEVHTELQEVVVEGRSFRISPRLDGYAINTQQLRQTRNNAFDLLSALPNIATHGESLKVMGKDNLLVMINKRLLRVSQEQLAVILKGYSASLVDKAEVITQPPSRYGADGNTAMIVLTMSSAFDNYFGGNVSAEGMWSSLKSSYHPFGMLMYNRGKLSMFVNPSYTYEDRSIRQNTVYRYGEIERRGQNPQRSKINMPYFHGGVQYDYNENGDVGLAVTYYGEYQNIKADEKVEFGRKAQPAAIDSTLFSEKVDNSGRQTVNVVGYWEHKLSPNGMKMWLDASYYANERKNPETYLAKMYFGDKEATAQERLSYQNDDKVNVSGGAAKLDFYTPLNKAKSAAFEAGLHLQASSTTNEKVSTQAGMQQEFTFKYNEAILTPYLSTSFTPSQKLRFALGSYFPLTRISGELKGSNEPFARNYLHLLPYLYTSYMPSPKHVLHFNYSTGIVRPSFYLLNPFVWVLNPYTTQQGNPQLAPSIKYSTSLNYTFNSQISVGAYYSYSINVISQVMKSEAETGRVLSQMRNAQNGHNLGMNASYYYNKLKWLQASVGGYFGYSRFVSKVDFLPQRQEARNWGFNVNSNWVLNEARTLTGVINFYYNSASRNVAQATNAQYSMTAGLSLFLLERKLNLQLYVIDLFTPRYKGEYFTNGMSIAYDNVTQRPTLYFTISYKFGKAAARRFSRSTSNKDVGNRF